MLWQLLDIAYVVPACVFSGYFFAQWYARQNPEIDIMTNALLISALLGFILTGYKIKKFIDYQNKQFLKSKTNASQTDKE